VTINANGSLTNVGGAHIGRKSGSLSTLTVEGDFTPNANSDIFVGAQNTAGAQGTLNVSGTGNVTLAAGKYLYINNNNNSDGSSGIVNIMGGSLTTTGVLFGSANTTVGAGTAQLNITGGQLVILGNGIHTGGYASAGENDPTHTANDTQINLGGGTIASKSSWTLGMNATLTGSNGNIKFKSINDSNASQTITINGVLSGTGGLEVTAGTLLLNGANTYKGQTIVSAGTLTLGNSASLTISLVNLHGLAAFDGTASGILNLNGTVSIDLGGFTGDYQLVGADLLGHVNYNNNNWLSGFTKSDNIWTDANGNTFNSTTGVLQVIPEPSAYLLLVTGVVVLCGLRGWRRVRD
jgi:autotransporter-associated beta strand protein